MNWADLSWSGEAARQRGGAPPNRRTVEVVTCPTCDSLNIERTKKVGPVAHWACKENKGCPNWKEAAHVGDEGRAHLA